jgi:succinyl-CoA synthetase alpha subunit
MMLPVLTEFPRRVVVFNATGTYAARQIAAMQEAGTRFLGGVALGRGGTALDGLPLFDRLADLPEQPDAALLYTPPDGTLDAIRLCAAAGIPTIVAAAEYVPLHDSLRAAQAARDAGSWLVGPNTLGLCVPGEGLLGTIAPAFCMPGGVALIGRSGTLTLATSRLMTKAGIGQRIAIQIGGDAVIGRNPHEYLAAVAQDERTKAVLYCGEIGGDKEYALAEALAGCAKPVVATLVGRHAPSDRQMGHAGALIGSERESAAAKLAALREAGAHTAATPYDAIEILRKLIPA